MRWDTDHESPDVIDRRGEVAGGAAGVGGLLAILPWLLGSRSGRIVALVLLGVVVVGGALGVGVNGNGSGSGRDEPRGEQRAAGGQTGSADTQKHFVAFVLDDVQKTWESEFASDGKTYRRAKLVLFTDRTQTACGAGRAATGPFYCPADERVYIDLAFYDQLSRRFGAKGDFAEAYVVAHEIGHHVQHLLGTTDRMSGLRRSEQVGEEGASVRLELQADCYGGIWAHSTNQRKLLESGDVEEALGAASAVGDDRLQKGSGGTVHPESFTHGTAAQRARWFKRGFESGKLEACNTFDANVL